MAITLRDIIEYGIQAYSSAIIGKGSMPGKQFADECRKCWSEENPRNANLYKLFEKYVHTINVKWSGDVSAQLINYYHN